MTTKFKPKYNEPYYYIFIVGEILVYGTTFLNDENDKRRIRYGNCFRTKAEATARMKLVKDVLKKGLVEYD